MEHPDLVAAAAALRDHAAHIAQCLDGRIILVLAVGGAKFPCDRASSRPPPKTARRPVRWSAKGRRGCTQATASLMMVSAKGRKGSTRFYRSRRGIAILPMRLSLMVHRDPPLRIETAGAGLMRARDARKPLRPRQIGRSYREIDPEVRATRGCRRGGHFGLSGSRCHRHHVVACHVGRTRAAAG